MEPIPTGEPWTEERLTSYFHSGGEFDFQGCIRDINAALAANDHKWNLARLTDIKELTDKHAQQLDAEREKWEYLQTENQLWIKRNKQLRTELAAERSLRETAQSNAELWHEEMLKVDKKLDAERERYRDVTNALGLYPAPVHEKVIAFIQQLREQLAAEREKYNGMERTAGRYARSLEFADKLNQQLSTELAAQAGKGKV